MRPEERLPRRPRPAAAALPLLLHGLKVSADAIVALLDVALKSTALEMAAQQLAVPTRRALRVVWWQHADVWQQPGHVALRVVLG